MNGDGTVSVLRVQLQVPTESASAGTVGLRVYVESGSDETCEQPLSPVWQPIQAITSNGVKYHGQGESEVNVPGNLEFLEVELAEPVSAGSRFELDVVRRRANGGSK